MTKIEKEIFDATINSVKKERDQLAEDKCGLMKLCEYVERTLSHFETDDDDDISNIVLKEIRSTIDKIKARE